MWLPIKCQRGANVDILGVYKKIALLRARVGHAHNASRRIEKMRLDYVEEKIDLPTGFELNVCVDIDHYHTFVGLEFARLVGVWHQTPMTVTSVTSQCNLSSLKRRTRSKFCEAKVVNNFCAGSELYNAHRANPKGEMLKGCVK